MIETVYLLDILNSSNPPTRRLALFVFFFLSITLVIIFRYGSQQSASYYGIHMKIRDVINDKTVLILGICLISAAL